MFQKSTRAIVNGKQPRAPSQPTASNTPSANPHSEPTPQSEKPKHQTAPLPKWVLWAALGFVGITLIVTALLLIPSKAEQTPLLMEGRTIVSVPADAAVRELVSPGDVVQLCGADSKPIPLLQYVQVYQVSGEHLMLLLDAKQQEAIISAEISPNIVVVAKDDPARSVELLEYQQKINHPQIAVTLPEICELIPGAIHQLEKNLAFQPMDAILPEIVWRSEDPTVASVQDGVITAGRIGSTIITVSCGDAEASCRVTVRIPVRSMAFVEPPATMYVEDTAALQLQVDPSDATDPAISWTSSDPEIAYVSQDGVVTACGAGTVTISARCDGQIAECQITVGNRVESVSLNHETVSIPIGTKYGLNVTVTPGGGLIDSCTWESSKPSIATVDENGIITAKKKGTTVITVRCGDVSASCKVTVRVPVSGLDFVEPPATMYVEDTATLQLQVKPSNATDPAISWTSSNTQIASVSAKGVVTAHKAGTVTISAQCEGTVAECQITVGNRVKSITLDYESIKVSYGVPFKLTATTDPAEGLIDTCVWSCSVSQDWVTLDQNGNITAKNHGIFFIYVRCGDAEATCFVDVID